MGLDVRKTVDIVWMENNVTMSTGLVAMGVRLGFIKLGVNKVGTKSQWTAIHLRNKLIDLRFLVILSQRKNNARMHIFFLNII